MLQSSGATFSLDNFLNAKPNQKKQFIQVAARRIADGLANLVLEKDCSCDFQFGIAGRSQCKIVDRREKEPLVVRKSNLTISFLLSKTDSFG